MTTYFTSAGMNPISRGEFTSETQYGVWYSTDIWQNPWSENGCHLFAVGKTDFIWLDWTIYSVFTTLFWLIDWAGTVSLTAARKEMLLKQVDFSNSLTMCSIFYSAGHTACITTAKLKVRLKVKISLKGINWNRIIFINLHTSPAPNPGCNTAAEYFNSHHPVPVITLRSSCANACQLRPTSFSQT